MVVNSKKVVIYKQKIIGTDFLSRRKHGRWEKIDKDEGCNKLAFQAREEALSPSLSIQGEDDDGDCPFFNQIQLRSRRSPIELFVLAL